MASQRRTGSRITIGHGTTILVYGTPTAIWIAADSKVLEIGHGGMIVNSYATKKIGQVDQVFFAFYWNPKLRIDNQEVFDAYETMRGVLRLGQAFQDSFSRFDGLLKAGLANALNAARKKDRRLISNYVGTPFLGMVMATVSDGVPRFINATYRVSDNREELTVSRCGFSEAHLGLRLFGSTTSINRFLSDNNLYMDEHVRVEDRLFHLVELEASEHGSWVGLPCHIVKISATGSYWTVKP